MELLHKELSFKLNGLAIEVRKEIGRFGKEKQYCDLYEKKLKEQKLVYVREQAIGDSGNRADFIVEDKILIEMKTKPYNKRRLFSSSEVFTCFKFRIRNYL